MKRYRKNPNQLFRDLCQTWQETLEDLGDYTQKIGDLLAITDPRQIRSTFALITGLGEEGICGLIYVNNGVFEVAPNLSLLYGELILEQVSQPFSMWYPLYQQGLFDNLLYPMSLLPKGSFMMGSHDKDARAFDNEKPRHKVKIPKSLWMGKYEVTQDLFELMMGENPSLFKGPRSPVANVTFCEATLFCNMMSVKVGLDPCYYQTEETWDATSYGCSNKIEWKKSANGYRLPTEAEWEYAARSNTKLKYEYSGSNIARDVAWYAEPNTTYAMHSPEGGAWPVGGKEPNQFGLYDMSGNVAEWVWDPFTPTSNYNSELPSYGKRRRSVSPNWSPSYRRVTRGGSYSDSSRYIRVATRSGSNDNSRYTSLGFRMCRNID